MDLPFGLFNGILVIDDKIGLSDLLVDMHLGIEDIDRISFTDPVTFY